MFTSSELLVFMRRRARRSGRLALVVATVLVAGGLVAAAPALAAVPGVDPAQIELTLGPGQSATVAARVTTPAVAPKPDIVLLADTTGSMDPPLANVRNNITNIMSDVRQSQPDAQFAVADYKDQVDGARVFRVHTPLTPDDAAVRAGTEEWLFNVGGGGAPWTDFINAHYRIATDAIAFRPGSTRIIAWFGDAVSRDPSLGHTLADTNAALQAVGARVVAVQVIGTSGDGLDRLGQATSLTSATHGVLMPNQQANTVAQALLDGIHNLEVTVTPRVTTCDSQITLGFDPASRTVRSGTDATFNETLSVRPDAAPGTHRCTVDFLVNGVSEGLVQNITVHVPGVSIGDATVAEGNSGTTPATFTVSLDGPATVPVTVRATTADGTATAPDDYVAMSADVRFEPGETSKPITVPVVGDTAGESAETFTVNLTNATGAAIADGTGVGTIQNDDGAAPPALSVSDVTVSEGDTGTTSAVFTVSLDRAAATTVTVNAATANGTATAPGDYTAGSADLTFAAGELSKQFTVPVVGDTADEPTETFTVNLTNATGATIADGSGVGTIVDDDEPPPNLTVGDVTVVEGNTGTTSAVFTVSLDNAAATTVTVNAATADGTATSPGDYTAASGQVSFAPGETSKTFTVPVVGDTIDESTETYVVNLTNATGATIADGTGVGTIVDDDETTTPPGLSIGDVSVSEGDTGTTAAVFTVSLDNAAATTVTVNAATADGTATSPGDYTAASGQVSFAPGETSKTFTVPVVGDTIDESTETYVVNLTNATGAAIADGTGVGTIVDDDDQPPGLAIGDVTVAEGNSGTASATFTVSLDRPAGGPVTVHVATADGTAVSPDDYTATSVDLTFAIGELSKQITVPVRGDTLDEPDETFTANLTNATGATILDATGVGAIIDDDEPVPNLSVDDATVTEGSPATFTISLDRPASAPVTVHLATADGTATSPADYTATSANVSFAAGESSKQVTVPVSADPVDEPTETFTVNLSNPSGATIADGAGVGTIQDDDPPPVLSINDVSVTEGGTATFTVSTDRPSSGQVGVHIATANGTATAPADYTATSADLLFPPGTTTAQLTVPVSADTVDELSETFTVNLSNPSGATVGDGIGIGTIVDDDRDGGFSCTATAVRLLGSSTLVANPAATPCRDAARTQASAGLGSGLLQVSLNGLAAGTDQTPDDLAATAPSAADQAVAHAELASTRVRTLGLTVELGAITSTATTRCVAGPNGLTPAFSGASTVASLKINGVPITIGSGPVTIPLLVGSLSLNRTTRTPTSITQQAVVLNTLLGSVVIGEAKTGVHGTAAHPTGTPCTR